MEIDFAKILYTLAIAVIGFFLRDFYNWIKTKLFKGSRPKVIFTYSYSHKGSSGTNPRNYRFEGIITIENIDKESIYDLNLPLDKDKETKVTFNNQYNPEIVALYSLTPNNPKQVLFSRVVQFKDTGNMPKEASKLLPRSFINPKLVLEYKNYRKKRFKQKVQII
ncbi:MAG: hypothetical protein DHS20C17_18690 [Cyclobacteriaceae bacterium]|nr:MAG: hypothetical protein DHS20C17_18690 [Cyclobacteriaceae bacterium]